MKFNPIFLWHTRLPLDNVRSFAKTMATEKQIKLIYKQKHPKLAQIGKLKSNLKKSRTHFFFFFFQDIAKKIYIQSGFYEKWKSIKFPS